MNDKDFDKDFDVLSRVSASELSTMVPEESASNTGQASTDEADEETLNAKIAEDREKEQMKANMGAKLLPFLGSHGLHPCQLLVDESNRKALFSPIQENKDKPKSDFVKLLDADKASQLLGYTKLLEEVVKAVQEFLQEKAKKTSKAPPKTSMLSLAFSSILADFKDLDELEKLLPSIITILILFP